MSEARYQQLANECKKLIDAIAAKVKDVDDAIKAISIDKRSDFSVPSWYQSLEIMAGHANAQGFTTDGGAVRDAFLLDRGRKTIGAWLSEGASIVRNFLPSEGLPQSDDTGLLLTLWQERLAIENIAKMAGDIQSPVHDDPRAERLKVLRRKFGREHL